MEPEQPKLNVYFMISDDEYLPEKITEITGITPSRSYRKGELKLGTNFRYKNNLWELKSPLPPTESIDTHVAYLFSVIDPAIEAVKSITSVIGSELLCVAYCYGSSPSVGFDNKTLRKLSELNAFLDIDIIISESE
jgi:hypothetical protein